MAKNTSRICFKTWFYTKTIDGSRVLENAFYKGFGSEFEKYHKINKLHGN